MPKSSFQEHERLLVEEDLFEVIKDRKICRRLSREILEQRHFLWIPIYKILQSKHLQKIYQKLFTNKEV